MQDLIRRCQQGDDMAWEELVNGFRSRAYRMARQLAGGKIDVEDLVQEAYLKVVRSIQSFRGDASFATWFSRILKMLYLDQLRKGHLPMISWEDCRETVGSETEDILEAVSWSEEREALIGCLKRLPHLDQLVVYLKDFLDYSYAEIAEMLQISIEAVRARLYRTRRLLRMEFANTIGI